MVPFNLAFFWVPELSANSHAGGERSPLTDLADSYEENPKYLEPGNLQEMADEILTLYRVFLQNPERVARTILDMEIRPMPDEAFERACELSSPQRFIAEYQNTINILESMGVIRRTDLSLLAELQVSCYP